ncbi:MAG: hypothetical protein V1702_04120 [Candidatus Woesearchaeota archaeon]
MGIETSLEDLRIYITHLVICGIQRKELLKNIEGNGLRDFNPLLAGHKYLLEGYKCLLLSELMEDDAEVLCEAEGYALKVIGEAGGVPEPGWVVRTAEAYHILSKIYSLSENFGEAEDALERSIRLDKENILTHITAAELFYKKAEYFRAVLKLNEIRAMAEEIPPRRFIRRFADACLKDFSARILEKLPELSVNALPPMIMADSYKQEDVPSANYSCKASSISNN